MSDNPSDATTATLTPTGARGPANEPNIAASPDGAWGSDTPNPSVYLQEARRMVHRWLRILGPAPWLRELSVHSATAHNHPSALFKQQAATLAIAMLREFDDNRPDHDYLRECVRASLVRWQSSLCGNGRPTRRGDRRSTLHGAILYYVTETLSETTGFQTSMLLADVDAHVRWLAGRPPATPWLEAALICALADAAILIRDAVPLHAARRRLGALLSRQSTEGWFDERGGPDVGRLSLTVDALARLYRNHAWPELETPLRGALQFFVNLVHPDGSIGGCYSSCGTSFVSPYGFELLAPRCDEAAALAKLARHRCDDLGHNGSARLGDGVCAVLGAGIMQAYANAATLSKPAPVFPADRTGTKRFPLAGLSILSNAAYHAVVAEKKGGAIHVTWRGGGMPLDDPGIAVVVTRGLRSSTRLDARTRAEVIINTAGTAGSSVTSTGILRREVRAARSWHRWFKTIAQHTGRALGLVGKSRHQEIETQRLLFDVSRDRPADLKRPGKPAARGSPAPSEHNRRLDWRRLTHDYFHRSITFGENWIRIRDEIVCRLPCKSLIVQSAIPNHDDLFADGGRCVHPPLLVDGGRSVQVTRAYRAGTLIDPVRTEREETQTA